MSSSDGALQGQGSSARRAQISLVAGFISALLIVGTLLIGPGPVTATTGSGGCDPYFYRNSDAAGEYAVTGGFLIGTRATINIQPLILCAQFSPGFASGSFQWAAVQGPYTSDGVCDGCNIVQVGYGRCLNTNNGTFGSGNCNGSLYWYWAWGSYCGGTADGSGGDYGPIPLRIGSAITSPTGSMDFYVLRHLVGGTSYYDGYANGSLLAGTDANGNYRIARVPASSVCWNSSTDRSMAWFGEVFNDEDSMGGWNSSGARDHLDYNPLSFSHNTGWVSPSNLGSGACDYDIYAPTYTCTIASNTHVYVDTISR